MRPFDCLIGIDYSGAQTPTSRLPGLQVFVARAGAPPEKQFSPAPSNNRQRCNWTRKEIAADLLARAGRGERFLAGIDHAFSFPNSYFLRYQLRSWPEFLADFVKHWPTDGDHVYVDFVRDGNLARRGGPAPGQRVGEASELRICERWTTSAKSVFLFDVKGSVAKSTHAGIPWLKYLRDQAANRIHFWPFDGWLPPDDKAVIAEVYPSLFRGRYPSEHQSPHERDAFVVAHWLRDACARGTLTRYLDPPLTDTERAIADREGWMLGVG